MEPLRLGEWCVNGTSVPGGLPRVCEHSDSASFSGGVVSLLKCQAIKKLIPYRPNAMAGQTDLVGLDLESAVTKLTELRGAAGFLDEILTYPSSAAIRNSANQYIPFSWHVLEGLRLLQPRSSLPVARIMFSAAESPPLKGNLYHTLCKHRYVLAIYECRS